VPNDVLNTLVTSAIWRAEQLAAAGLPSAYQAWHEVSSIEEELAKVLPACDSEGRIARRGAVRAALKAGDYDRAHRLTESYVTEHGATKALKSALKQMLAEDAKEMEGRFPFAAKYFHAADARRLARHLHDAGAFGLAA
jgi:hypothetical protein